MWKSRHDYGQENMKCRKDKMVYLAFSSLLNEGVLR